MAAQIFFPNAPPFTYHDVILLINSPIKWSTILPLCRIFFLHFETFRSIVTWNNIAFANHNVSDSLIFYFPKKSETSYEILFNTLHVKMHTSLRKEQKQVLHVKILIMLKSGALVKCQMSSGHYPTLCGISINRAIAHHNINGFSCIFSFSTFFFSPFLSFECNEQNIAVFLYDIIKKH